MNKSKVWGVEEQIEATRNGVEDAERKLQIHIAWRDEEKHTQELINDLFDKFLDLGKLLMGVSLPALFTVYAIKGTGTWESIYFYIIALLLFFGFSIFGFAFRYKIKRLIPLLQHSTIRLDSLSAAHESIRLYLEAQDLKNPIPVTKKKPTK